MGGGWGRSTEDAGQCRSRKGPLVSGCNQSDKGQGDCQCGYQHQLKFKRCSGNYTSRPSGNSKRKVGTRGERRFPADAIYQKFRLMNLPKVACSQTNALRKNLIREPDALIAHVRFDERERETESWIGLRHRHQAKAAGQPLSPEPNATAPVLDSTSLWLCFRRQQPCLISDEDFDELPRGNGDESQTSVNATQHTDEDRYGRILLAVRSVFPSDAT